MCSVPPARSDLAPLLPLLPLLLMLKPQCTWSHLGSTFQDQGFLYRCSVVRAGLCPFAKAVVVLLPVEFNFFMAKTGYIVALVP